MGYAWIYNKTKSPNLDIFPEIMNILETGLQKMCMTEDSDGTGYHISVREHGPEQDHRGGHE
eukprot:13086210-Heterocapsa_arctica.AAC.1